MCLMCENVMSIFHHSGSGMLQVLISDLIVVCVDVVPVFEVEPQSTVVPPGGVLELVCLLDPKTSDIRWTRDGQSVADGGGVVTKGGLLRITNMSQALTGNYECVASTSYGSVVSSAARVQIASKRAYLLVVTIQSTWKPIVLSGRLIACVDLYVFTFLLLTITINMGKGGVPLIENNQ